MISLCQSKQLQDVLKNFPKMYLNNWLYLLMFYSLFFSVRRICWRKYVAQLNIWEESIMRGIHYKFNIFEKRISLGSFHGKTTELHIFERFKSCLENLQLVSSKLNSVCTDEDPSMISTTPNTSPLFENHLDRSLLKYHCIIHKQSVFGETLKLPHLILPGVKFVYKIRSRGLSRCEFREYCELWDLKYDDVIHHCGMRWFFLEDWIPVDFGNWKVVFILL